MSDSFDQKAFRRALGNFATGITVITATAPDGKRAGITANSFNSVSLDPPLILWSLEKSATSLPAFTAATHFAVNILAADQMNLSNHFASPSDDKFRGVDGISEGPGGCLLLDDCAAQFVCKTYKQVDGGDHVILIGEVISFKDEGRQPLCYHQGAYSIVLPYSRFADEPNSEVNTAEPLEGRLSNNLFYLMTQAVRSYQSDYQPLQAATGLQIPEARLLMILEQQGALSRDKMTTVVNLPGTEIDSGTEMLLRKGLITRDDNQVDLTEAGRKEAKTLWKISSEEQDRVFSKFSAEDIEAFKRVLTGLIAR